jgi:hypothetical protein
MTTPMPPFPSDGNQPEPGATPSAPPPSPEAPVAPAPAVTQPTAPMAASAPAATPVATSTKSGRGFTITGIVFMVLSVIIGIAGIVGIVLGASSLVSRSNDWPRVNVPGEQTITLEQGTYNMWVERNDGITPSDFDLNGTIIDRATGREVYVDQDVKEETYSSGDRAGKVLGTVTITTDGTYDVSIDGSGADSVAFGDETDGSSVVALVVGIFGAVGGGFMFFIGLILLIVGLVKRGKAKRAVVA